MAASAKVPAKTAADFFKAHDLDTIVPELFRAGIKALGPNGWLYLGDFQRANRINPTQGAAYRDQFKQFIIKADDKYVVCGSVKLANRFRKVVPQ
jgi:hypothetical protein